MSMTKTFPDYQQTNGWNALLSAREASPALQGDLTSDVLIIGAGWTGIAAAKRWQSLSPEANIVLIDASENWRGQSRP